MRIISVPGEYCFIGNMVVLELETDTADPIEFTISALSYKVELTGYPYKQDAKYRIRVAIEDVLSSFFDNEFSIIDSDQIISRVNNLTMQYTVTANQIELITGFALRGGISKAAIKRLAQNNFDIFSYKIMNSFGQFIFTTRTFGTKIPIKDTELSNFLFLHPGATIRFVNNKGNSVSTSALPRFTPCSMNVAAVYNQFLIQHGSESGQIYIYVDTVLVFSFIITPGTVSENNYAIRFRNSFGVFELIEVTGTPYQSPEFGEEKKYQTLTEYGFHEERRQRGSHTDVLEMETGYKSRAEHSFVMDMIKSEECYFIFPDGNESRCLVSAENIKYQERMTTPSSIKLKVRMVDSEEYIGSGLDMTTIMEGRIFDPTFDNTFN